VKVLLIRLDKIGDLVSSLPIDELSIFKNHQVHWAVTKGLGAIVNASKPERQFTEIQKQEDLVDLITTFQPDIAITFFAPWWTGWELFKARVPVRVGRASQWHSFLFFNKRLRQKRSLSEKHEVEYNRDLVEFGLGVKSDQPTSILKLHAEPNRHLLEKFDLQNEKYFVVHPGMAGSALNWPAEKYNELIAELIKLHPVVVTGTPSDEQFVKPVREKWLENPRVRILQNKLTMTELLSILRMSVAVIAPSTGVIHLASSLGVKCVGIYSPILTHHPKRWGPRGSGKILMPSTEGPDCMNEVSVQNVLNLLK
jgi:heptosyltransferase I